MEVGESPDRRLVVAVVAIAALAIAMRLFRLDARVAHWDEARVGYDILRFLATGTWEYRPLVHGPFLPIVNRGVFAAVGPSDFAARLVVAVVGGLFPLVALLFRRRFSSVGVIALAGILALDPVLLYYSRFMRNDVLVAAFALTALGFVVRFLDTGRRRHLHATALAAALAFTTKENALLYLLAMLGAGGLLLDQRLLRAGSPDPGAVLVRLRGVVREGLRYSRTLAAATFEFLVVIAFFYAPRNDEIVGVGLWDALDDPGLLPGIVRRATVGSATKVYDVWVAGGHQNHPYLPYLEHELVTLGSVSGGIVVLAAIGFAVDRYGEGPSNPLVALGSYWALASAFAYPLVVDLRAAWTLVHLVVPLALPAAAGADRVAEWLSGAVERRDWVTATPSVLLVVLVVGQLVFVGVTTSYAAPQSPDNPMVQYAQPSGDLKPTLHRLEPRIRAHEGADVVWFGASFFLSFERLAYRPPVPGNAWYHRLPLPWYFEMYDASVRSARNERHLSRLLATHTPPAIVTTTDLRSNVSATLASEGMRSEYRVRRFALRQRDEYVSIFLRNATA